MTYFYWIGWIECDILAQRNWACDDGDNNHQMMIHEMTITWWSCDNDRLTVTDWAKSDELELILNVTLHCNLSHGNPSCNPAKDLQQMDVLQFPCYLPELIIGRADNNQWVFCLVVAIPSRDSCGIIYQYSSISMFLEYISFAFTLAVHLLYTYEWAGAALGGGGVGVSLDIIC